jgi:protein-S-isoprenylcysteine O-methyltransferase Ste14
MPIDGVLPIQTYHFLCCNGKKAMRSLELKIPPPLVALLIGVLMRGLSDISMHIQWPDALRLGLAMGFFALGGVLALAGAAALRKARTTVNPIKPETASSLVTTGIYRHTRNPMYVSLAAILVGWAVYICPPRWPPSARLCLPLSLPAAKSCRKSGR